MCINHRLLNQMILSPLNLAFFPKIAILKRLNYLLQKSEESIRISAKIPNKVGFRCFERHLVQLVCHASRLICDRVAPSLSFCFLRALEITAFNV
jgi:hypothetical protein